MTEEWENSDKKTSRLVAKVNYKKLLEHLRPFSYKTAMIDAYDSMGLVGVTFSLYAYARVQFRREYAKNIGYSLANLLGASFLAVSLANKWNLASFTGNVIWALLSLFGVYRCVKYMRKNSVTAKREGVIATDPLGR